MRRSAACTAILLIVLICASFATPSALPVSAPLAAAAPAPTAAESDALPATAPQNSATPQAISFVQIEAGAYHTCGLTNTGLVYCWGANWYGQLGNGTTDEQGTPVAVSGLNGAVAITAGVQHTCALLGDGTARCWGDNSGGQLGDGTTTDRLTPVAVSGLSGAVAIAAGDAHTCALLRDGTARCWGANSGGQLGDGTTATRLTPVAVSGLSGAIATTAGWRHTCTLLNDSTARCWGANGDGQLGDGATTNRLTPVAVSGLSGAVALAAGGSHTCALLRDGAARCWGYNYFGQLGDSTTTNRWTPVAVSGLSGAVALAAGFWHTCALLNDGTARCWGYNYFGQLGDGTAGHSPVPVTVVGSGGGAVANCARFVADVNYPDGSIVSPGQVFEKRWRLRNCGTASWSGYQAERMSGIYGPASFPVSGAPGATVEVAATFTAPATPGTHRATYQLRGPNGLFGDPFWVEVRVSIATPTQPPPPPLPPPSGPSSWRVPFFSQGDPQWGSARMMTCNLSISGFGCALTSLAMIYGAYGVLHNPRTLNTCLGDDACPLRWSSFNLNSCSGSKVAFSARPAFSYQRLEEELRRGPVIVELSNSSGSQHFVVVIQGRGNDPNNYTAHDPGIRNGANQPLSKVLNFWKTYQNLNLTPHSLRTFNGTAIPASISDTEQILPKPEALSPTAEETITGTVTIYDTTDTTIILELAARSSTSNMIEMRVWTDQRSSDVWQPFSPYVEVPMDAVFFVQFRDAAGNASTVIEASVPIASSNVSSQEVYLPMVVR